jgi:hypothetical protein
VDKDVPEGDYAGELGDRGGKVRGDLGELVEGLSDDLELALDGGAEHRVRSVVGEGLAAGEISGEFGRVRGVPEVLARVRRHIGAAWCA